MIRIGMIIDESGSMGTVEGQAMESFNKFIEEQKQTDPTSRVTLRTFSYKVGTVFSGAVGDCPPLTSDNYEPWGGTALLDAIGDTLDRMLRGWEDHSEPRPQVIVVILTDGMERDSKSWSKESVRIKIARCQQLGWRFVFLGAGTYWRYGLELGIDPEYVLDFKEDSAEGIVSAFAQISNQVSRLRLEHK